MSLFRSEMMGHYDLVLPRESAWYIMNELGQYNNVMIEDLNKDQVDLNKPYFNQIQRCV